MARKHRIARLARPGCAGLALLLALGCSDAEGPAGAAGAADDTMSGSAPHPAIQVGATRGVSVPAGAPTAEDSAAALIQDVSPEWMQRGRSMASYEECIAQARDLPEPVRTEIVAACARGARERE